MDESNQIIVLDNLITGDLKNIEKYKEFSNFKFVEHDIQESIYFDEKIDYVVHLASCASPKAYAKYPINTLKSGSIGTINALGISKYHNAKFFLASTSEIYGDPEISPQNEEYWGNVNILGPRSMYDESKRFAESATHSYITTHNLNGNIARIFNTYGPNMQIDDGRVVTNFIYQALKGKEVTIYGNGEQTRSFLYIDECIEASRRLMDSDFIGPVNIGSEEMVTINELVNKVAKVSGKAVSKRHKLDAPLGVRGRNSNNDLIREAIGWDYTMTLEEGLSRTYAWINGQVQNEYLMNIEIEQMDKQALGLEVTV